MNRFIMGRLGVFTLLAALAAVGCAVEQGTGNDDTTAQGEDGSESDGVGTTNDEQISAGEQFVIGYGVPGNRPDEGVCAGCGPLPDPWKKMGPLPDPWTTPDEESSSSSSGSSGSTSSSSTSSSGSPDRKP